MLMGGFLIHTLAFLVVGAICIQQGFFAPRALSRFITTTSPSETLSSSADFLASPVIRLSCSVRFLGQDEEGFSSSFRMSLQSCCRYCPARVVGRLRSGLRPSMLPSPYGWGLGLRGFSLSRPFLRLLSLRPNGSLTILEDGFVNRLQKRRFPSFPAIQATRLLIVTSVS